MDCAAEQLDKAEQLIDAMKGPELKARWIYFLTVLQQAIDYMVMAKDDLERSEVISEHSEVVSILNEAISELSEELEDRKQQPLKALEKANETSSAKAKSNYAQWQAWAELIWLENPHWFKNAVAARIKELHDIKAVVGTIADKLKKPDSD